jgi:hypothetical protein
MVFMLFVPESPRWTAKQDNWEETTRIISKLRALPADHSYVRNEIQEMADQLENERALVGDATTKSLLKEMWTIPGNRKRSIITIMLMIWQQMTGVNAIVLSPFINPPLMDDRLTLCRTTTRRKSSRVLACPEPLCSFSPRACTASSRSSDASSSSSSSPTLSVAGGVCCGPAPRRPSPCTLLVFTARSSRLKLESRYVFIFEDVEASVTDVDRFPGLVTLPSS